MHELNFTVFIMPPVGNCEVCLFVFRRRYRISGAPTGHGDGWSWWLTFGGVTVAG
jgi:hypothetical protein